MKLKKIFSIFFGILILFCIYSYPIDRVLLTLFLLLYLTVLIYFPRAWLIVIPLCLPALDLAPYTGRFFFDEFDFLILVTYSHFLWSKEQENTITFFSIFNLVCISIFYFLYMASLFIGLLPWQSIDANSFSNYYSYFNSLRVAKGAIFAILLLPLLRRDCSDKSGKMIFSYGVVLGFVSVCFISLWERFIFPGLFDYSSDFRITSWFSSMHTGGGHIDTYIMLTFPFLSVIYKKPLIYKILTVIFFILGIYVSLVTFSRGVYLGFIVEIFILFFLFYLHYKPDFLSKITLLMSGFIAIVLIISFSVFRGEFINKRINNINNDFDVRMIHWQDAISMMNNNFSTKLLGMGLGSYPRTYYILNSENVRPASSLIIKESEQEYLRISKGDPLYMGQYIDIQSHKMYILKYDQRTGGNAKLSVSICEKSLLYSFECNWLSATKLLSNNEWQHVEILFNMGDVGEERGAFQVSRPVQLALNHGSGNGYLEIDNIKLTDEFGQNIISNGGFEQGLDRWFFSTENHMPWHIKNLWVYVFFEQGVLGLFSFCVLVVLALVNLKSRIMEGDYFACILISSLCGFFVVSVVASPFDAPRLTLLFFIILFFSLEKVIKPGLN